MAHTESTPYANLPKFAPSDKPTWLGDFNNAMAEIDGELAKQNAANTQQDIQIADALKKSDAANTAAGEAKKAAEDAAAKADQAMKKFPVQGSDIADGSITAPKLDTTAISSIIKGLTIRAFDSSNPNADNEGLYVTSGVTLNGAYIPELEILFIREFKSDGSASVVGGTGAQIKLPSYVRRPVDRLYISGAGIVVWDNSSDFKSFSAVSILANGALAVNTNVTAPNKFSNFGNFVVCMSPYTGGAAYVGDAYTAFKNENGVL